MLMQRPCSLAAKPVRQDLHVAREHDEIGLGVRDDLPDLRFLLHLGLPGDRQIVEGDVAEIDVGIGLARIVGDDRRRCPSAVRRCASDRGDRRGNGRSARPGAATRFC